MKLDVWNNGETSHMHHTISRWELLLTLYGHIKTQTRSSRDLGLGFETVLSESWSLYWS